MRLDWDLYHKFKAICAIQGVSCSQKLQELMQTVVKSYTDIVSKELAQDLEGDAEA